MRSANSPARSESVERSRRDLTRRASQRTTKPAVAAIARTTRTRPTAAGKLWRGRQRFHTRRGQGHRGLRELVNGKIDILYFLSGKKRRECPSSQIGARSR